MNRADLDRILEEHRRWRETDGRDGRFADLEGVNLDDAYLNGANLAGANLNNAYLLGANLARADLRGADLNNAYLRYASLRGADLRGANLVGANLAAAHLYNTNVAGVRANWFTRMTARGARNVTDEQRAQLGMQPPPRARNARRATDLARRLSR